MAKPALDKKSLKERILKTSVLEYTESIENSKVYGKKWLAPTGVPLIDLALSGRLINGGLTSGITVIAGESKHFKTGFALKLASAFQKKFENGIVIMYDSEFGSPPSYLKSQGIDTSRFIHSPITNIEELQFDMIAQLNELNKGDPVFIMIDSLGNLASKKEAEDMKNQKAVQDMSRNRALKSLFRTITPILAIKEIPLVIVSHVYDTMDFISTKVVSGGKGQYYSADNVWIVNRRQSKDSSNTVDGFDFIITVDKSRYVKEKSKFPISIRWKKGIDRYSGLLDIAIDLKVIKRPSTQTYVYEDIEYSRKEIEENSEVLEKLLNDQTFIERVETEYVIPSMLEQLRVEKNESI